MSQDTNNLLPCPFCGSTNIDPAEWSGNDGKFGPGCGDCGALGESAELWNRRASQPVAAPGMTELSMELEARMLRTGRHLFDIAMRAGWPDDGEGAYEFVQRMTYAQGREDAQQAEAAPAPTAEPVEADLYDSTQPVFRDRETGQVQYRITPRLAPQPGEKPMKHAFVEGYPENFQPAMAIELQAEAAVPTAKVVAWRRATKHGWEYRTNAPTASTPGEGWLPMSDLASPAAHPANTVEPDECAANMNGHRFGPHGRKGEMQCEWCGVAAPSPVGGSADLTDEEIDALWRKAVESDDDTRKFTRVFARLVIAASRPAALAAPPHSTPLPWRVTSPDERKGPREIVGANGSTVAKLTVLDLPNAELIVACVNRAALTTSKGTKNA